MKVAFYAPDGAGDKLLVAAVMGGAARHGDDVVFIPVHEYAGVVEDADAAGCYGVRASTRIILDAYRRAGKRTLMFDKGYWGRGVYTRVAVDAWHPTRYLEGGRSDARLKDTGLEPQPEPDHGSSIVYAATTQTWHDFYDLGPARACDELIVKALAAARGEEIIYRPRPAYAKKHPELCRPIEGSVVSTASLQEEFRRCRKLVTIGSNIAVDAVVAGIPTVVLGDNPCSLLNHRRLSLRDRRAFLADLAWHQWTLDEYHSGEAWVEIRKTMGAA